MTRRVRLQARCSGWVVDRRLDLADATAVLAGDDRPPTERAGQLQRDPHVAAAAPDSRLSILQGGATLPFSEEPTHDLSEGVGWCGKYRGLSCHVLLHRSVLCPATGNGPRWNFLPFMLEWWSD